MKRLSIVLLLILFLAACAPPAPSVPRALLLPAGAPSMPVRLYRFLDGQFTDYGTLHPEYGPIGSVQFVTWEDVNPAPGAFNWSPVESILNREGANRVTLADGSVIVKPVIIQVENFLSTHPLSRPYYFYDATPQWVYQQIGGRPSVGGRLLGHLLTSGSAQAVVPMYDNQAWRNALYQMVAAFGARYEGDPRIAAVFIRTGLDGETQFGKTAGGIDWQQIARLQVGGLEYRFGRNYVPELMQAYRAAFPTKPLYIDCATGLQQGIIDLSLTMDPPIGIKNSGLDFDIGNWTGYGAYPGMFTLFEQYAGRIPIWLETRYGLGNAETRYWTFLAGLSLHPDGMDVHPEFLPQSDHSWLAFVQSHLGVTIDNTPDVWTVLRDAEYPRLDWGSGGQSGHIGDWTFWLQRLPDDSVIVKRAQLPAAAQADVRSRQARRFTGTMSFDIDDRFQGDTLTITLLDEGTDTLSVSYCTQDGNTRTQTRYKTDTGQWVDWTVSLAGLAQQEDGADLRVDANGDGAETLHMVRVSRGDVPQPTPRPTATIAPTIAPSNTPTAIVPTATPTPSVEGLPEDEPGRDLITRIDKLRWWLEEAIRSLEAGDNERTLRILRSLVKFLYVIEGQVKGW
jgi:hypothetical protein